MRKNWIAPSILSCDLSQLGAEVTKVVDAGADCIHVDVMDNHYVPNLTFGPWVCESLRKSGIQVPLDVHLMIQPVDGMIERFAKAGASSITFHPDATHHIDGSLSLIHSLGCQAGLAFNPAVGIDDLQYVLDKVDIILIMSVNPGFGGQAFIPSVLPKIKQVRELIDKSKRSIRLSVDGGIGEENIREVLSQGADCIVMGSAVFASQNPTDQMHTFRKIVDSVGL